MSPELAAWVLLGLLALVAAHEAAHVAIARCHGHPTICVAVNPIGVAVLFEDGPGVAYRLLQVLVPALVSWGVGYLWLWGLFASAAVRAAGLEVDEAVARLPWTATLLTVLTSLGDAVGGCLDLARPVSGRCRAERGLLELRRLPALVLFTAYGRAHWRPTWLAHGERAARASTRRGRRARTSSAVDAARRRPR